MLPTFNDSVVDLIILRQTMMLSEMIEVTIQTILAESNVLGNLGQIPILEVFVIHIYGKFNLAI